MAGELRPTVVESQSASTAAVGLPDVPFGLTDREPVPFSMVVMGGVTELATPTLDPAFVEAAEEVRREEQSITEEVLGTERGKLLLAVKSLANVEPLLVVVDAAGWWAVRGGGTVNELELYICIPPDEVDDCELLYPGMLDAWRRSVERLLG